MSTFYVDSAQEANEMFKDLEFDVNTLDEFGSYCAPITSQEGTIIINTDLLKENNLPAPTCLKDLADPVYKDMISVTDVASSSTAWLLINGREKLQAYYPNALYEGETTDGKNKSTYPKVFSEPLTVDLLEQHQELSESCK